MQRNPTADERGSARIKKRISPLISTDDTDRMRILSVVLMECFKLRAEKSVLPMVSRTFVCAMKLIACHANAIGAEIPKSTTPLSGLERSDKNHDSYRTPFLTDSRTHQRS